MNNTDFIVTYVQTCASGKLGVSDCGPVWQLSVIAALLLIAIVTLLVLRLRARVLVEKA
jgi:hypothetical protein